MNTLGVPVLRGTAAAVGLGALVWAFGVPLLQSSVVGAAALAVVVGAALRPLAADVSWPDRVGLRRHGTRREVARLSSSLAAREREVPAPTVARLRVIAEQRLARAGVDPKGPGGTARARELLGAPVHALLFGPDAPPPDHRTFVACLDAVERLARPSPAGAGPPRPAPRPQTSPSSPQESP